MTKSYIGAAEKGYSCNAMKVMDRAFQRKILEAYLAVIVFILTVITYIILAGVGFEVGSEFVVIAILIIILIGINVLNTIIGLRTLDCLDDDE